MVPLIYIVQHGELKSELLYEIQGYSINKSNAKTSSILLRIYFNFFDNKRIKINAGKLKSFSISKYDNLSEIKYLIDSRSCLHQTCILIYHIYVFFIFFLDN